MITEAEAKTKWCPFSFGVPEQPGLREGGPWRCCTTLCMAWREQESPQFARAADLEFQKTGRRVLADTGYCSLMERKP